ncbi:MAG TPA: ATP-binding protein, partial [Propionibacterium sp.]|nr:ATP-binding protein [Propionibacterium sp.]
MVNPLIDSLLLAVDARPDDVPLRLHVAELLLADGRGPEAVQQCAIALQHDPTSTRAHEIMGRAFTAGTPAATDPLPEPEPEPFNWSMAEQQFGDGPKPMFVTDPDPTGSADDQAPLGEALSEGPHSIAAADIWEVEKAGITLADVGGMQHVKERLEISFLAPMRNPDLRKLYGKSLRGGLLLYGPPGCGKTYIARAVAGEMGAGFINVTLSDVLDMYIGQSEGNLHELFELARRSAPAVLFLDEIDAIGHKRTQTAF